MMFLFAGLVAGQSDRMQQKAIETVEELNTAISSIDSNAALSQEQKSEIQALTLKKMTGIRKIKKSDIVDEKKTEKIKALRKEINSKIYKEVLTKEQRKAKRAAKSTAKG